MNKTRRYDLDWLRVISVFAVFLHHVFMPFNGDNFHIMNTESSKLLDDIMVYFEQFRLPLLFFVSGVGTVFAFSKRNWITFVKERSQRLLIPLFFGVFILIPPQTYFEHFKELGTYFNEYPELVSKLRVNHLWFIENLFLMSLCFIPFILFFRSSKSDRIKSVIQKYTTKYGIFTWVVLLIAIRVATKYYFPNNAKSFTNPSTTLYYSFFFVSGIIIANTKGIWELLYQNRKKNFILVIISTSIFYFYYLIPREFVVPYFSLEMRWHLWYAACSLVSWSVIICCLGYSQVFFTKTSKLLTKLNEAVYPFYMLHQTIIIIIGYYILQINTNIPLKIGMLFFSSLIAIICLYLLLIYPFKWMRFLFGMKNEKVKK